MATRRGIFYFQPLDRNQTARVAREGKVAGTGAGRRRFLAGVAFARRSKRGKRLQIQLGSDFGTEAREG